MNTTSRVCCSLLSGVAMLWAAPALAQDAPTTVVVQPAAPEPPPPAAPATVVVNGGGGGRAEGRPALYPGLIWGGVALWGLAYSGAVITGAVANDACSANTGFCIKGREIMYVPVVGPFAAMGSVNGAGTSTVRAMLAIDGMFQLGGVAMAVTGIVLSATSRPVRAAVLENRKLIVTPYADATSAGLGAIGRF